MLSEQEFIQQSLETNLFFLRVMTEHAFFLETGLTSKNSNLKQQAKALRNEFTEIFVETIALADGNISKGFLKSGEMVSNLTVRAEQLTEHYLGMSIDSRATLMALAIGQARHPANISSLVEAVSSLNKKAITRTSALVTFTTQLLEDSLRGKIFMHIYPQIVEHSLKEDRFYLNILQKLQKLAQMDTTHDILNLIITGNDNMAEHARFVRGLLDPSEVPLFNLCQRFNKEFEDLTYQSRSLLGNIDLLPEIVSKTHKAAGRISIVVKNGVISVLNCQTKSIVIPLFADHIFRETNHYYHQINLLKNKLQSHYS